MAENAGWISKLAQDSGEALLVAALLVPACLLYRDMQLDRLGRAAFWGFVAVLLFHRALDITDEIRALDGVALVGDGARSRELLRSMLPSFYLGFLCLVLYKLVTSLVHTKARLTREKTKLLEEIAGHSSTQRDLEETEQNFRELAESTAAAIFVLQGDRCRDANSSALRLIGSTAEEIADRVYSSLPFAPALHSRGPDSAPDKNDTLRTREVSFNGPEGDLCWLEIRSTPIEYGRASATLVTAFDITERKIAEEARHAYDEEIGQLRKLESLGLLAGGVAHDFNNLLVAILGHADLALLEVPPESTARENLTQIRTATRHASDLAGELLAAAGKGKRLVEAIDLSQAISEIVRLVAGPIPENITIEEAHEDSLPSVDGDATQIGQVILNLLQNAKEALEDGGGTIRVRSGRASAVSAATRHGPLRASDTTPYVYLEVQDDGPGIDQALRSRIFDPFFTTKRTGRGLGLAAALGIVRGHGGSLEVETAKGRGTTMRVLLPAGASASPPRKPPSKERGKPRHFGGQVVLVIDDEESVRNTLGTLLEHVGFSVLLAADGRQGIELFRRHSSSISLVVLDMTMPGMGGEETLREIRRISADTRVVLVSGYDKKEAGSRFAGQQLAGFLQKPFGLGELISKERLTDRATSQPRASASRQFPPPEGTGERAAGGRWPAPREGDR